MGGPYIRTIIVAKRDQVDALNLNFRSFRSVRTACN